MKIKLILSVFGVFVGYMAATLAGFAFAGLSMWAASKTTGIFSASNEKFLLFFAAAAVVAVGVSLGCFYAVGALDRRVARRFGISTLMPMKEKS